MFRVLLTDEFQGWLEHLADRHARMRIVARIRRAGLGNFGDWRPIQGGISELRIDHGPGYRVYFTVRGRTVVIILIGGDKSSQRQDIEKAKRLLAEMRDG